MTQNGFEGCIKDLQLGSTNWNISAHIEAKDILPGCPEVSLFARFLNQTINNFFLIRHSEVFKFALSIHSIHRSFIYFVTMFSLHGISLKVMFPEVRRMVLFVK